MPFGALKPVASSGQSGKSDPCSGKEPNALRGIETRNVVGHSHCPGRGGKEPNALRGIETDGFFDAEEVASHNLTGTWKRT